MTYIFTLSVPYAILQYIVGYLDLLNCFFNRQCIILLSAQATTTPRFITKRLFQKDIHLKRILNSNLAKSLFSMADFSVSQSFWNFAYWVASIIPPVSRRFHVTNNFEAWTIGPVFIQRNKSALCVLHCWPCLRNALNFNIKPRVVQSWRHEACLV